MVKKPDNRSFIERVIDDFNFFGIFDGDPERARHSDGTYQGDDPSTSEVNEAWEKGKAPKKARKRKS